MSIAPYKIVADFESALCEYTGARFAVSVNSCTNALFLSLKYVFTSTIVRHEHDHEASIPRRTYVSVPMQILHAGGRVLFRDEAWSGLYQLKPYPIYDAARRFTGHMYLPRSFMCVSFHASKILGIEQGGAILHDDEKADEWFRKARWDGRTEGVPPNEDNFDLLGYHCTINPSTAAQGLLKLYSLPKDNPDLPNDDYCDLSKLEIFK